MSGNRQLFFWGSGAYAVESWKEGCTHVLVDEGSAVKDMVIAAAACRKPVVQIDWWQVINLLKLRSYLCFYAVAK